jgi:hypothetical protein
MRTPTTATAGVLAGQADEVLAAVVTDGADDPAPELPTVATRRHRQDERTAALRRLQVGQLAEARRIRRAVAHHYGLRPAQLSAPGRHKELAEARQVAMYLMRTELCWPTWSGNGAFPLTRIAALLGRDHATVAHGVGRIAAAQATDAGLRWTLATIREALDDEDAGTGGTRAA